MSVLLTWLLAAGLAAAPVSAPLQIIPVALPNGTTIEVELARTAAQRSMGLMFRQALGPDEGMLFVFDLPDEHRFWMRNTLIPLDIIWMDRTRKIVHIESNVPPCQADPCATYGPKQPILYVLELAAGRAAALGLKVGQTLGF
jgi:uncharacterized membrane protein (UPF0127 family)